MRDSKGLRWLGRRSRWGSPWRSAVLALFAGMALAVPAPGSGDPPNQPRQFDYQERTGFPLAFEERVIPLREADQLLRFALREAGGEAAQGDWNLIRARLDLDAPHGRANVRVVRVYSDQPVFFKQGFALVPDPSQPEARVSAAAFVPAQDCVGEAFDSNRCIALNRDHVQNRDVIAVLIAARTIIVKGANPTGGLSLITLTENLWMQDRDDRLDLSARRDAAPTLGLAQRYQVYAELIGSPAESRGIDEEAAPDTDRLWRFQNPDLQWQFDRARAIVADYDWSQRDPCVEDSDPIRCRLRREKRGFAGLPGGHWLGLTYRATTVRASSFGQPGGNGGPGIDHLEEIVCAPAPVFGPRCGFLLSFCDGLNKPPQRSDNCGVDDFLDTQFPSRTELCACDNTCEKSRCNVNYKEEDPTGQCVVTCGIEPFAEGFPGGQAGPGGLQGILRVSVVTRHSGCSADFTEESLSDPALVHAVDERCLNSKADDGDPNAIDCASKFCRDDPNVLVCPVPERGPFENLKFGLAKLLPPPRFDFPVPDLRPLNPIIDPPPPDPARPSTERVLVNLGDGLFAALPGRIGMRSVVELGGTVPTPVWGGRTPWTLPDSLLTQPLVFQDAEGVMLLPSAEAQTLLASFTGEGPRSTLAASLGAPLLLGFEGLAEWSSSASGLTLSPEHTEGSSSLSVPGAGWVELTSAPLPQVTQVGPILSLDLLLPDPAADPWWAGSVAVALEAPSAGVWFASLGQQSLQGVPRGAFHRFTFAVPPSLSTSLTGSHADLRVKIQLNVPAGAGRYLFDRLALGSVEGSGTSTPALVNLHVSLPERTPLAQVAIGAGFMLSMADHVRVVDETDAPAPVTNTGSAATSLGVATEVGPVLSVGPVTLADRALVEGDLESEGTIGLGSGAFVSGRSVEHGTVGPQRAIAWSVEVPAAVRSVTVGLDGSEALPAGSYSAVNVKPRGRLALKTGTYFFESLSVEPEGKLDLDTARGPVVVYVQQSLMFWGRATGSGKPERVLVAYTGTAPSYINGPFIGTLVAPAAHVRVGPSAGQYAGALFAKWVEIDGGLRFQRRSFAFWSLITGSGGGNHRVALLLDFVRSELVAHNPDLAASEPPSPRFILEVARASASQAVRSAVADFRESIGGRSVGGLFIRAGEAPSDLDTDLILHIANRWAVIPDHVRFPGDGQVKEWLCGDDATGGTFNVGDGPRGEPGAGGAGAEKRCNGWNNTMDRVCVRSPLVAESECRRKGPPDTTFPRTCPDVACQTRYEYPDNAGFCPPGHLLQFLRISTPLGTFRLPPPCPSLVHGLGGVQCEAKDGARGRLPQPRPKSALTPGHARGWALTTWAIALDRLHPLDLQRRVGRANTLYKRGEDVGALARYLATRRLLKPNIDTATGVFCRLGEDCNACLADPTQDPHELHKRLCVVEGDLQTKLRQLERRENAYGYLPDFVPPTSARTHDPLAIFDLVRRVEDELDDAEEQARFWELYGQLLSDRRPAKAAVELSLDRELDSLDRATGTAGALSLEFQLADQKVDDTIAEVLKIKKTIQDLQVAKAKLKSSGGGFEVDILKLGGVILAAAATAYGGPLAGAAVLTAWQTGASAAAKEAFGGQDAVSVEIRNACAQIVEQKAGAKKPDFSSCGNKFKDQILAGLAEELGKPILEEFKKTVMAALELGDPKASNTLADVVIDTIISELMVELFHTGNELGQNLLARRIAQEKFVEARRQMARIQSDRNTLRLVGQPGTFPAPEVQLQIAELSLQGAARSVEQAGEFFFLLRRGVERDVIPIDPVTGENLLARQEEDFMSREPRCGNMRAPSLDINLLTIPCFQARVDFLSERLAAAGGRSADFLELEDTGVPFERWTLTTDSDGEAVYVFDMPIAFEMGQRGTRKDERKQKVKDMTFFLESDDPVPAAVRMKVSRPVTSPDVYFIGQGPGPDGNPSPQFQTFDIARGSGATPNSPLFEILRDRTRYEHIMFACNALTPGTPGPPALLEQCRLSNLGDNDRAFLEGRSLIGTHRLSVRVADLAGRTPRRVFASVKYTFEAP